MKIASTADAKEAITGKSLKISFDSAKAGERADIAVTDPAKYQFTGWHSYNVKLDVRVLAKPPKDDTYGYFKFLDKDGKSYGWATIPFKAEDAGQVKNITIQVDATDNGPELKFMVGAHCGCDFVIDNVEITERK